jgi:hypothetical protein
MQQKQLNLALTFVTAETWSQIGVLRLYLSRRQNAGRLAKGIQK